MRYITKARNPLRKLGIEDKRVLSQFEGSDWKANKKVFLEQGPQTYELPGEKK